MIKEFIICSLLGFKVVVFNHVFLHFSSSMCGNKVGSVITFGGFKGREKNAFYVLERNLFWFWITADIAIC